MEKWNSEMSRTQDFAPFIDRGWNYFWLATLCSSHLLQIFLFLL